MTRIEKLVRNRSRMLTLVAAAFTLWQGGDVLVKLLGEQSTALKVAEGSVALGGIIWMVSMVALVLYQRQVRAANAASILDDDWNRHIRNKAKMTGFACTVLAILVCFALGKFVHIPSDPLLQGLLMVAVVSSILSYVWLERKTGTAQ